jgi:hypothetical protein
MNSIGTSRIDYHYRFYLGRTTYMISYIGRTTLKVTYWITLFFLSHSDKMNITFGYIGRTTTINIFWIKTNGSLYIFRGIHIFFKFLNSQVFCRDSFENDPGRSAQCQLLEG